MLQETHFRGQDTQRLTVQGWGEMVHCRGNQGEQVQLYLYQSK